ncbi:hypothetical protein HYC85_007406 [Camellia sinensis]|uniref:Uncharacterized protein n=1 Tax=Camellia sinensis TaxID=4442 RepID=A0A7J7HNW1_CAMSI|nr:hypothetical protein HYC85_007406 [Camellia sinensis]
MMQDASSPNRTLDLASALEVGPTGNRGSGDYSGHDGSGKSVMTIAFQFAFEIHLQENIAAMGFIKKNKIKYCSYGSSVCAKYHSICSEGGIGTLPFSFQF